MKRAFGLLFLALFLVNGTPAKAGIILDLGFSNGLSGWKSSDATLVSASGGIATINESPTAQETDLYNTFKVPVGAQTLSFTLNFVRPDNDDPNVPPPDAFGASLLNPTSLQSLVPTVVSTTDSFYIRDVITGTTTGEAATGVTVSPSPSTLPLSITVDISKLVANQNAEILFRLLAGGDLSSSSIGISLVHVNGTTSASVPEPSSIVMLLLGLSALLGLARRRGIVSTRKQSVPPLPNVNNFEPHRLRARVIHRA